MAALRQSVSFSADPGFVRGVPRRVEMGEGRETENDSRARRVGGDAGRRAHGMERLQGEIRRDRAAEVREAFRLRRGVVCGERVPVRSVGERRQGGHARQLHVLQPRDPYGGVRSQFVRAALRGHVHGQLRGSSAQDPALGLHAGAVPSRPRRSTANRAALARGAGTCQARHQVR